MVCLIDKQSKTCLIFVKFFGLGHSGLLLFSSFKYSLHMCYKHCQAVVLRYLIFDPCLPIGSVLIGCIYVANLKGRVSPIFARKGILVKNRLQLRKLHIFKKPCCLKIQVKYCQFSFFFDSKQREFS